MRRYLFILVCFFSTVAVADYERAFDEISNAPDAIRSSSCYKLYMVKENAREAVEYLSRYEHKVTKHLDKAGYSRRDIEIALFAKKKALEAQWSQMFFAYQLGEDSGKRYVQAITNTCLDQS